MCEYVKSFVVTIEILILCDNIEATFQCSDYFFLFTLSEAQSGMGKWQDMVNWC